MERRVLSDKQWALMAPHCLGKPGDAGPRGTDKRLLVEAVLWIVRTGSPWRDLPEEFGKCNTVFKRFRDWVKAGIWQKLFDAVSGQPDMQYAMVDATIVKVHRHGQGAKGGLKGGTQSQAIGHSRGGVSTKKILALCDALGNLVKFALMPGQRHDSKEVE